MVTFTFNGIDFKDEFITNKVRRDIYPDQSVVTRDIPGQSGSSFVRNKDKQGFVEVDITLDETSKETLRQKADEVAGKLIVSKPSPLVFSDEPTKTYYAVVEGSSTLAETLNMGEATITFLCPNPYKYETETQAVSSLGEVSPTVSGNVGTYPIAECTITADATEYVIEHVAKAKKVRLISPFVIGDTISINFNTGKILINGLLRMTTYDFTNSRWFTLDIGANVLTVSDDTTIKWRPAWR